MQSDARILFTVKAFALLVLVACDDPKSSSTSTAVTASAVVSAPNTHGPSPEPPQPSATSVSMDENAVTVNGTRIPTQTADFRQRLSAELMGKPRVANETVSFIVARASKMNKVALAVLSLRDAKAKDAIIKGPRRDGSTAEMRVGFGDAATCTAVAYIGKDVSIAVWGASGTPAKRYSKGMAGPDTTLGSQGLERSISACSDSNVAMLGADESITWGLVFDLGLAARENAKPPFRAERFILLSEAQSPGRAVKAP
jgi:hypothetical protein